MAGITRTTVQVLGINVATKGGVTNLPRQGFVPANGQTVMDYLSLTWHPKYPAADLDPLMRQEHSETNEANAATWAGRPRISVDAFRCCSSARSAERAVQFGWASFARVNAWAVGRDPGKVPGQQRPWLKPSRCFLMPPFRSMKASGLCRLGSNGPGILAEGISAASRPEVGTLRSAAKGK
jgi:hypothetical protein